MPSCAGLNRKRGAADAWAKCPRQAVRGDRYCAKHRDALDGAFLGLLSRAKSLHAIQKIFYEEAEARRKELGRELSRERQARRTEKKRLAQEAPAAKKSTGAEDGHSAKESRCAENESVAVPVKTARHEEIAASTPLAGANAESG